MSKLRIGIIVVALIAGIGYAFYWYSPAQQFKRLIDTDTKLLNEFVDSTEPVTLSNYKSISEKRYSLQIKREKVLLKALRIAEENWPGKQEEKEALGRLRDLYLFDDPAKAEVICKRLGEEDGALARIYMDQGRIEEAGKIYRKALSKAEKSVDKIDLASRLCDMGCYYIECKQWKKAEPLLRRSVTISEELLNEAKIDASGPSDSTEIALRKQKMVSWRGKLLADRVNRHSVALSWTDPEEAEIVKARADKLEQQYGDLFSE